MPIPPFLRDLRAKVGHEQLLLPTVCGLVFDPAGELLLGRRSDTGTWALIGGLVEPGEQVADAVVREVHEETSVLVRPDRITGVYTDADIRYPNGDRACYVVTVFACTPLAGHPAVGDEESLEVGYFALDRLPPLAPEHLRRVHDALRPGSMASFAPPRQVVGPGEEQCISPA